VFGNNCNLQYNSNDNNNNKIIIITGSSRLFSMTVECKALGSNSEALPFRP